MWSDEEYGTTYLESGATDVIDMVCTERTLEFQDIARTLLTVNTSSGHAAKSTEPVAAIQNETTPTKNPLTHAGSAPLLQPTPFMTQKQVVYARTEFTKRSKQIAKDIQTTSEKLHRLAKLAKRTSIYNDPTTEIQELTYIIKQDIRHIQNQITELQQNHSLSRNHLNISNLETEQHSLHVVDTLKSRLMTTTKEFRDVLQVRSDNMKTQQERRSQYASSTQYSNIRKGNQMRLSAKSALASSKAGRSGAPRTASAAATHLQHQGVILQEEEESRRRQQMAVPDPEAAAGGQLESVSHNQQYYQGRQDAVKNIESTIIELGSMFQQLSSMIAEQNELVERLDANVDDSLHRVEAAKGALLEYLSNISSNRWLMIKIFGVLALFVILFAIVGV